MSSGCSRIDDKQCMAGHTRTRVARSGLAKMDRLFEGGPAAEGWGRPKTECGKRRVVGCAGPACLLSRPPHTKGRVTRDALRAAHARTMNDISSKIVIHAEPSMNLTPDLGSSLIRRSSFSTPFMALWRFLTCRCGLRGGGVQY